MKTSSSLSLVLIIAAIATLAVAQDYKGWTSHVRDECRRAQQALCNKSSGNYQTKVTKRLEASSIVKRVEQRLNEQRQVVRTIKAELRLAELALVRAKAEEATALKYTTWVCKNKMRRTKIAGKYYKSITGKKHANDNEKFLASLLAGKVKKNETKDVPTKLNINVPTATSQTDEWKTSYRNEMSAKLGLNGNDIIRTSFVASKP